MLLLNIRERGLPPVRSSASPSILYQLWIRKGWITFYLLYCILLFSDFFSLCSYTLAFTRVYSLISDIRFEPFIDYCSGQSLISSYFYLYLLPISVKHSRSFFMMFIHTQLSDLYLFISYIIWLSHLSSSLSLVIS